jgi:hypothetical protein
MVDKNIKISSLQVLLDDKYGKKAWIDFEPETILFDLDFPDYLVMEKIYVLQALNHDINRILSLPEFLLWEISVSNNEYAEFETINIPTSLELAWGLEEAKKIAILSGQSFKPTLELIEVLAYILNEDGFSKPCYPFEFIPQNLFHSGQTEEDSTMKAKAIKAYIKHMDSSNV